MRSFDILEDRRSSWWKGPRHLSHCLEVSTEKLPDQGTHTGLRENKHLRFVTAMSIIPWHFFFKRASLVLVVFKSIFWFIRKTLLKNYVRKEKLRSCCLWKENTYEQSTDNIFRYTIQYSAGWSKSVFSSNNDLDICITLNLGKKLLKMVLFAH